MLWTLATALLLAAFYYGIFLSLPSTGFFATSLLSYYCLGLHQWGQKQFKVIDMRIGFRQSTSDQATLIGLVCLSLRANEASPSSRCWFTGFASCA